VMHQRDKRALGIAAMAAAVFLALEFGLLPMWDRVQAERDGLAVREQTFLKFRQAVASQAEREAETALLQAQLREAETGLLSGETPAIASAALRELVQQLAAEAGMEVRSSQFLAARPLGEDYLLIPLGVQLRGRIEGLTGFLRACETGATALSVSQLNIQSAGDAEKNLTVTLTVAGILPRAREEAEGTAATP